jgi:hypothetical protein
LMAVVWKRVCNPILGIVFSLSFWEVFQKLYSEIFQVAFDCFQNAISIANFILLSKFKNTWENCVIPVINSVNPEQNFPVKSF